ncbi:MAG: hypothetical protein R3231_09365 [bacterium]|nr:hypothetical protein [bacterium]
MAQRETLAAKNRAPQERWQDPGTLQDLMHRWVRAGRIPRHVQVIKDTSDFFQVKYNDILVLRDRPYLVGNTQKEGRFGLDDEPKFWVRRAIDLSDGSDKIIKMVFREKFQVRIGTVTFDCVRSARKEARILKTVRGHPRFMQGFAVQDAGGNTIRIIDYIHGKRLFDRIPVTGTDHEDYFAGHFPDILNEFIDLTRAIQFLHERREKHGDIRSDHLIHDRETGQYRWIDFDYNYLHRENFFGYDLFGLGNILAYITGRGDVTLRDLQQNNAPALERLVPADCNIIFNNRVMNLRKVYPYIPGALNQILLHFSLGTAVFYENTAQFLADLEEVNHELR